MAKLSPTFFQLFDNNGEPLAGGKLSTFEAGTTTNKQTFTSEDESAANTNPVILDSAGRADVWLESGSYKFVLTDADDVAVDEIDNITGDASNIYGASVIEVTSNLNITSVHRNNILDCDGTFTLSLLDVASAEEGFLFVVKNSGTGTITIDPDAAELIDGSATKLIEAGGSVNVVCTGTEWITFAEGNTFLVNDQTTGTITASDEVVFGDVDASNVNKKTTVQAILALSLPVGSIYMNASVATNPATLLGFGVWTALGVDRVLIGVGASNPTAGATGGSDTRSLSSANNAAHTHVQNVVSTTGGSLDIPSHTTNGLTVENGGNTDSSGSGTAFSIVQSFEVVYMWKRTS